MSTQSTTQPTGDWLYGFWYRAARSAQIKTNRLHKTQLLGIPLVMGRTRAGAPFAMRDACPHRGIPLSYGWFKDGNVQCAYHGWCFEPKSGQCQEIPSLTSEDKLRPDRIYATAFPCEERDGYLWVYVPPEITSHSGGQLTVGSLPEVPRLPTFSERYILTHLYADMPTTVDHGIIGLMDPAHGPFVHEAWWWRSGHSIHEKHKDFEPIPNGFRMAAHQPSKNSAPYKLLRLLADADAITTTIDFVLPNLRYETIRAGKYWFASLTTVTPVERNRVRIDVAAAWNMARWASPLVLPVARHFAKKFIHQDVVTMEQQAEGLRSNPNLMLVDDADRPAKWYFALKQAYLDSQRTGAPLKHPIDGPVTLHWRS
jgi:phenylpropionate dioxygenase-like ring-hydroxylating dioxygenase large terminal subunit